MEERLKLLYLLRGLPGSGKTTLANTMIGLNFESDMFFRDEEGNYNYDPKDLRHAQIWCLNSVMEAMEASTKAETTEFDRIIVSNDFTLERELDEYYKIAESYGYHVFSVVVENRHNNKPGEIDVNIKAMLDQFETKLI